MVNNGWVHVVRFFSKALVGRQLKWSVREKTDHIKLTYLKVTLTGKVLQWKFYLPDKDFDFCHVPTHCCGCVRTTCQPKKSEDSDPVRPATEITLIAVNWDQTKCRLKLDDSSFTERMSRLKI